MSHMPQGVYAPLPQSLSDSDSEKELTMDSVCNSYNNKSLHQNGHINQTINKTLPKIKHIKPKMSTMRKAMFVLSILLCCLPVVLFLWVLPCSNFNTCPIRIGNWDYQQFDMELKGRINLVRSAWKNTYNMALLYKSSLNLSGSFERGYRNGAVSFVGKNGAVAWMIEQQLDPYDLNCGIVDVDGNGILDCLLLDQRGLKAIETISGMIIWHVHSHDQRKTIMDLTMAVRLTDFNGDKIDEILTIYQGSSLLIVCGKSGKALESFKPHEVLCNEITDLVREPHREFVGFQCRNGTHLKQFEMSIKGIYEYYRKTNGVPKAYPAEPHESESYQAGDRRLTVENIDKCPDCHAIITLYDSNNKKLKTWNYPNSHIMKPKPFSFHNTPESTLQGHTNGFVVKIWQWTRRTPHKSNTFLNEILERTALIMFNSSDIHVINASLTEVHQLCFGGDEKDCQPDYRNQEESVLVADLDEDGSLELISFSSSYSREGEEKQWHLVSSFRVFRLEGELPKLYGAK